MKKHSYIISSSLAIAVTAFLLTLKLHYSHHLINPNNGLFGLAKHPEAELILLGTSHMNTGFNPEIIERESGLNPFLISYSRMNLFETNLALKVIANQGLLTNRKIIIEIYPFLMLLPPRLETTDFFYNLPYDEKLVLMKLMNEQYSDVSITYWSELILGGWNEDIFLFPFLNPSASTLYDRGMKIRTRTGMTNERFKKLKLRNEYINFKEPLKLYDSEISEIISLLKSHGQKPIFLETPLVRKIEEQKEIIHLRKLIKTKVEKLGGIYVNGSEFFNRKLSDAELFYDDNHLSAKGRDEFSRDFGKKVNELVGN